MIGPVLIVAVALLGYALVSRRLASTPVTAAMVFAAVGLVVGADGLGLVDETTARTLTSLVLEAALVLVLFTDAMGLDLLTWRRGASMAARLLTVGLVGSLLVGAVLARLVLPDLPVWQALLLAAILAPTDAALGQAVVANERVPVLVRNSLNVESGLNDGLALPFVVVFLTLSTAEQTGESELAVLDTFVRALILSPAIGIAVGAVGGWLLARSRDLGWSSGTWRSIGLLALAAIAFLVADAVEGSGFIGAWVAGLVTGRVGRGRLDDARELPEELAGLLGGVSFLLFGAVLLGAAIVSATPTTVLYALLSLTVVRLLPVAIALARTGLALPTVAYVGWFGPRGLASIVFAGLLVEEALPGAAELVHVVALTVASSIVLHGATAVWGARRYADWYQAEAAVRPDLPEGRGTAAVRGRVAARAAALDPSGEAAAVQAGSAGGNGDGLGGGASVSPGAADGPSRGEPTSSS